jgi:hypothetical protein
MLILLIKLVHTAIFLVLAFCILYLVYAAVFNRRNKCTLVAFILVAIEGIAVIVSGWECPLAELAESLGAEDGSVTGIFLPPFLAGRVFQICTPLAAAAIIILGIRILSDRKHGRRPDARKGGAGARGKNDPEGENP